MTSRRTTPSTKKSFDRTVDSFQQHPFEEGWGMLAHNNETTHWFQLTHRGRLISICHTVRESRRRIIPGEGKRKCRICLNIIARSGVFNPVMKRRSVELDEADMVAVLKVRLAGEIARFMGDPVRGPRLYVCPTCRQAFEGRTEHPHFCEGHAEKGHSPIRVLELARKDSETPPGETR